METGKQDRAVVPRLAEPLRALAQALGQLNVPGMLIGGLAAIIHGVPRATRDVDATLRGDVLRLEEIAAGLARLQIVPRIPGALEFAALHQVLLLRHEPSGVDVDLSLAWLPFELEAIQSALHVTVDDVDVPVVRPEDLIIYKTVAWRPQDQQDVERLLSSHGKEVNLNRVRQVVSEFAEALEDPERLVEFERLARRLGFQFRS